MITDFGAVSLTDIVFILLIFFLLSASFVVQSGIKVKLPEASETKLGDEKQQITVTITNDKDIYLNGIPVILEELRGKLAALLKDDKDQMIVIKADADVELQDAVSVMDAAKAAGSKKFMIATENRRIGNAN